MHFEFKYGSGHKTVFIPDKAVAILLQPKSLPALTNIHAALEGALKYPLGEFRWNTRPAPREVVIAVPDETRPTPFRSLLPHVCRNLQSRFADLQPSHITIIIGGGLHAPMEETAARQWVQADKIPDCRICVHDPFSSALTEYGRTYRGTPVAINSIYTAADLKMVIGQIDPHQFVGFTGGAKGVVVGCASPATIEHNHSLMFEDGANVGCLEGNPVREDLNEAGRMVGIDLALNAVLDPGGHVVGLWAGEPIAVLKEGAKICARVYGVPISRKFDMAVASCGGYPKDICLYQAQKGLNLVSQAVKPGGKILLLAECTQGVGDDVYYEYECRFETSQAAMADFKSQGFKMGAHKSYLFGKTLTRYEVVIDTGMPRDVLRNCHLTAGSAQEILDRWIAEFPGHPSVAVVPNANTTYFFNTKP